MAAGNLSSLSASSTLMVPGLVPSTRMVHVVSERGSPATTMGRGPVTRTPDRTPGPEGDVLVHEPGW